MNLFSVSQISKHFIHDILFEPHDNCVKRYYSFHFTQEKLNYFDWVSPEAYKTRIQVHLIYMGADPRKH